MTLNNRFIGLVGLSALALIFSEQTSAGTTPDVDSIKTTDIPALNPTATPSVWTFNDCLTYAFSENTDLRRVLQSILTAQQDVLSAKDAWLPTVDFSTNHSYTNFPTVETGRKSNAYSSTYNIGGAWTVWDGNIRKYRTESAKLILEQQQLNNDDICNTLTLGILEAYLNIMYANEAVGIAEQTLQVSTTQAERARRLTEAGRMSRVEYAQIESQRAQDQYNLTVAESSAENARLAMKKILQLGLDYDLKVQNVAVADADFNGVLLPKTEVFDLAAAWLPQFKINELSKSILSNDVKVAKAGRMPNIALQGNLGTGYATGGTAGWASSMGHNFNENIGVTLSIPIFDGNATKRAVAKAKIAEMDYDITRKELYNNLSQTIESLYIDATNARAKYQSGLVQLDAMQLTDDLVNRQFELGYVNPLDLLTAHNNLLNARLELLQSKYLALLASKTINYYATGQVQL